MDSMFDLKDLQVVIRPYPLEKAKLLKDWTTVFTVADITNRDFEADRRLQTRTRPITRLLYKRTIATATKQSCSPQKSPNKTPVKRKPSAPIYTVTPIRPESSSQLDSPTSDRGTYQAQSLFHDRNDDHDHYHLRSTSPPSKSNRPLYQPSNSMLRPLLAPILKDTQYDPSLAILPERQTRSRFKNSPIRQQKITTPRAKTTPMSDTSSVEKKKVHFSVDNVKGGGQGDCSSHKPIITNGATTTIVNTSINTINGGGGGASPTKNKPTGYRKHNRNDLSDLIPPGIEMFGCNNAHFGDKDDNVDSDSISSLSSDGSFYSCDGDKVSR